MEDWQQREKWEQVLALAKGNFGYISLRELVDQIGFTENEVRGLVRCMKLERSVRGYYRVADMPEGWRSRLHLYALASGGLARECSAGLLHGLIEPRNSPVKAAQLWVPRRTRIDVERLELKVAPDFDQLEWCEVEQTPCTSVERTLIDIAANQSRHFFLDCYNVALRRKKTTYVDLCEAARVDGRRGLAQARAAIAELEPADRPAQSEWSLWAARRSRAGGLPEATLEHRVLDGSGRPIATVDLFWAEFGVALELDGRPYHDRHADFERDRARDAQLAATGIVVVRVTWSQYRQRGYLVRIMREVLAQRGWTQ